LDLFLLLLLAGVSGKDLEPSKVTEKEVSEPKKIEVIEDISREKYKNEE